MVDGRRPPVLSATLLAALPLTLFLAGCGQTGDLYLPQQSGEVVTRPTQTPPPLPGEGESPNSPQSADSPAAPSTPAPEVTEPEKKEPKQQPAKPR
jgi:predicted small lipoprotein YifL